MLKIYLWRFHLNRLKSKENVFKRKNTGKYWKMITDYLKLEDFEAFY
jgi:hypothetical protein